MSSIRPTRSFQRTLTEGSVRRHLLELTVPMVWGILATLMFNIADTYFVAKLGTLELAALSFTFPVSFVLISLAIGLGAGASSVIARAIGEDDRRRVRRLTSDSLMLSFLLVCLLSAIGFVTIDPLFRLLGAGETVLPAIRAYMQIWYCGMIFVVFPMVGMAAVRASGDSRLPSQIMLASALVNIVLDPLLIFGIWGFPALGIRGAAIASVIARAATFVATLVVLHRNKRMLTLSRPAPGEALRSWKGILHVGLPAAATNMIIPISIGVVTAMVARYGEAAVAGFGVASRIESIALVPFYAMSSIVGPFVGQNLGARKTDRIAEAMRESFYFCLAYGAVAAALLALFGSPLAGLFDDDATVVTTAVQYMQIVPLSYGLAGVVMNVNAAFNGLGRPVPAVKISFTRMVLIYLPAAYLGRALFGVPGIFGGGALANLTVGLGAYLYLRRQSASL
jgi:putative MATE family efflux protein